MYEKYNQIFLQENHHSIKDPQIFPSSVLFSLRKNLKYHLLMKVFDKIKK
jgi:hypothetical protein